VVLKPKMDYWEGVARWGYPLLIRNRWCYRILKREPALRFLKREMYEERLSPLWCLGIRLEESKRRDIMFREFLDKGKLNYQQFTRKLRVWCWFPILEWPKTRVIQYIKQYNVPQNPSWRLGMSGECLCMSSSSRKMLDRLIVLYPEVAKEIARRDREVRMKRRDPRPICLKDMCPLYEYIERRVGQRRLNE